MSILATIIDTKKEEVELLKTRAASLDLYTHPFLQNPQRGFLNSLTKPGLSIISEVKKASPSKGLIREDFQPEQIAKQYLAGGADCLSVLTDEKYFLGSLSFLTAIRQTVPLPLLRKDFIIDPLQIFEAKIAGADAILLIAEALDEIQIKDFTTLANELHMDVLLELHNEKELDKIDTGVNRLIGINNRDLTTFHTDINTSVKLRKLLPDEITVVSESGINDAESVKQIADAGIDAVLVGEHFMRQIDIADAVRQMKKWAIHEN